MMYVLSGSRAARMSSGTDAMTAMIMPMKWVIALPGSLIRNLRDAPDGFCMLTGVLTATDFFCDSDI